MSEQMLTARQVAAEFQCSKRTVTRTATELGIGLNIGGRAGYRFTRADIDRLRDSMRPAQPVQAQDPRGRKAS